MVSCDGMGVVVVYWVVVVDDCDGIICVDWVVNNCKFNEESCLMVI